MEKNLRFSNQSLSKGQIADSKKSQESSVKWPRHSKRREQANFNGSKPENFRNTSSKASTAGKTRNQTNYSYDKRSKQRSEATGVFLPDATASALESTDQFDEQHEGTGLALHDNSGSVPVRHELHSVFSPGSKKQSLNHLLNFHYAPRERDQPVRFSKTGNNRGYVKKISYNKEQFLQANCQFVVRADEDYATFLASPDQLVDWAKIEQIHILSSEEPQCPICLYPPVAAKMTKCGHVYCWPCILHYLALSDKTWRKCPICYDAIHLPDLRSAVSKPFHSYAVGEYVTFQLMRREKKSMSVVVVSEIEIENPVIPYFDANGGNTILTKLLLASTAEVFNIINREQQELENQMVVEGIDCPENIFVQQALDQLKERKQYMINNKPGSKPVQSEQKIDEISKCEDKLEAQVRDSTKPSLTEVADGMERFTPADFMIDEDNNFSLSDIDIIPTSLCASSDYFYFYQSTDGQPLYLHSVNTRMLQAMYGSLDKSPQKITGKIVHKDSCSMSDDLRKRLKYLQHLPVCSQFEVVEIEFENDVISSEVQAQFKDELISRRKNRQKRARAERIRERQIFEFNERQLGKSMARSAKIPIDSTKHFPSCGNVDLYDFSHDPALAASSPAESSASAGMGGSAGTSWSKMLSTSPAASRWPTLPSGGSVNAFGPLAAPPPKLVQITGTKMAASTSVKATPRRFTESDSEENDDLEEARVPVFRNDLSYAIEAALEKATLNGDVGIMEAGTRKPKSAVANGGTKKKKNKKTLLFASGMNLN